MLNYRTSGLLIFCLCLPAILTACQYQPSSLARTEVPLFIPPNAQSSPSSPQSTATLSDFLPTVVEVLSTATAAFTEEPACQLSTDPDYGFSPDQPIQVGSNQLSDGPARELTYLLTLRGPNGEEVFFTRQAPQFNLAGTIVDPYLVEYEGIGESVILYFDLYTYTPLFVPLGFSCEAPFPIQPPQE
jgi:hypothetical protein